MRTSSSFLPLLLVAAACSGNAGVPASLVVSLRAVPPTFAPGDTVVLKPVFADGTASIQPDVGPVISGESYRVGPVDSDRRYVLTVLRANGDVETTVIDVPLRYRERIAEVPPSPSARTRHGAPTLADGRVLLVGGASTGPVFWTNTETFDADFVSTPVGELSTPRAGPVVVSMPGGGAFAFGGATNASSFEVATRVEEWDPQTLAWSVRGNLTCNRERHSATRLPNGTILVAGGLAFGGLATDRDAEIWVPGIGSRQPAGEMLQPRVGHTATLLANGRVLLAGGYDPATGNAIREAELFDPALDEFLGTGSLAQGRYYHAAVPLRDGRVMLVGGEVPSRFLADAEIYDPSTGLFTATTSMQVARSDVRALRLGDGSVLVAGGTLPGDRATDLVEVWQPANQTWRTWEARLPAPRTGHSLSLLPDARVAVLGGDVGRGFPAPTAWLIE